MSYVNNMSIFMNNLKSNTFFTICKDELETIKISTLDKLYSILYFI